MNNKIYSLICNDKKKLALLIDPEFFASIPENIINIINNALPDFIFVGGSIISSSIDELITQLKKTFKIPIILFPGSLLQLSNKVDAILFLSLISGRNPDFLIGHHVIAAPYIKKMNIEVIPTGYILINGKSFSTVQYISNTIPIPSEKHDVIVATAIAGEMLGLKLIYLEAGSGAEQYISPDVIKKLKENINIPIIVGGGIKDPHEMIELFDAGTSVVVISTVFEKNPDILIKFYDSIIDYNKKI